MSSSLQEDIYTKVKKKPNIESKIIKSPKKIKRSRAIIIGWIKNFPTGLFKRLNFVGVFVL